MKLGNIKYKGKNAYGCYITSDFESFDCLHEARQHTRYLKDKTIKYVIQDDNGNTLKLKIVA